MSVAPRSHDPSPAPVAVERASSEVLYSGPSSGPGAGVGFARSRRSLAEPPSSFDDADKFHPAPPMIAPVSGVPNLKVRKQSRRTVLMEDLVAVESQALCSKFLASRLCTSKQIASLLLKFD